MNINSRSFGFAVAIVAAFMWSIYSLGNLILDVVVIALVDDIEYTNLSHFHWADYANEYLVQVIIITFATGLLGWLAVEIYNELNNVFSLKLK